MLPIHNFCEAQARSSWQMQSAASNLTNFKTPLILQPKIANYFECPSSALQNSTYSEGRDPSALKLLLADKTMFHADSPDPAL